MTNRDLETVGLRSATDTHEDSLHSALLSDSYTNVAARGERHAATDRHRTAEAQPKAGEQPDSKATQLLKDAINTFEKSTDKDSALKAAGPKFEAAIKQADSDYETTIKTAMTEAQQIKPAVEKALTKQEQAKEGAQAALQAVPEKDQEKVQALVQAYLALDTNDPFRKQIEQRLSQYPAVMPAVKGFVSASNDPALLQMQKLENSVQSAVADRVQTRITYADALKLCGHNAEAEQQQKDAAKILGIQVPENKPDPSLREA